MRVFCLSLREVFGDTKLAVLLAFHQKEERGIGEKLVAWGWQRN